MIIKIGDPTGEVPFLTLRSILRAIRDAEVIVVAFPRIYRALIVDLRTADSDYPIAFVATIETYGEDQFRAFEATRPEGAPPIERFSRATWGGAVTAFDSQGVLGTLMERVAAEKHQELIGAYEQLQDVERGLVKSVKPVGASKSTEEPGGTSAGG